MSPNNGAMIIGDYGKGMPTADPGAGGKAVGLWREKQASSDKYYGDILETERPQKAYPKHTQSTPKIPDQRS